MLPPATFPGSTRTAATAGQAARVQPARVLTTPPATAPIIQPPSKTTASPAPAPSAAPARTMPRGSLLDVTV